MAQKSESDDIPTLPHRRATVYDAVAGRVGYEGFLSRPSPESQEQTLGFSSGRKRKRNRDTSSRSEVPIPPEEVLFRRTGAPIRYVENDIYFANRHLDPQQKPLPESDLLKVLHAYCSDFYGSGWVDEGKVDADWRSLDETALLAMGILMEEACQEVVGRTGDLALLEDGDDVRERKKYWAGGEWRESVIAREGRQRTRKSSRSSSRRASRSRSGRD